MVDQEIKVENILDGSTSLLEAADKLMEKAANFTSYAGQGYTLANDIKDGYGILVKPDQTATNDRDRLAEAFMDLKFGHKYNAPIDFAWKAHCVHEAAELIEEAGFTEDDPIVFWVSETDDDAFGYQGWSQVVVDMIPDEVEKRDGWIEANQDFIKSQEISERLAHNTLIGPLPIYWRGDPALIVTTLRKHGLEVIEPESEEMCVVVIPQKD